MADKIVSWGGFDSKGTSGMGVTGSFTVSGSMTTNADITLTSTSSRTSTLGFYGSYGTQGIPGTSYHTLNVDASNNFTWTAFRGGNYETTPLTLTGGSSWLIPGTMKIGGITTATINSNGSYTGTYATLTLTGGGYNDATNPSINFITWDAGNQASRFQIHSRTNGGGNGKIVAVPDNGNFIIGSSTDLSAKLGVKGSGTTSSTTSFLVQNANASASLSVLDNSKVVIGTETVSQGSLYIGHNGTSGGSNGTSTLFFASQFGGNYPYRLGAEGNGYNFYLRQISGGQGSINIDFSGLNSISYNITNTNILNQSFSTSSIIVTKSTLNSYLAIGNTTSLSNSQTEGDTPLIFFRSMGGSYYDKTVDAAVTIRNGLPTAADDNITKNTAFWYRNGYIGIGTSTSLFATNTLQGALTINQGTNTGYVNRFPTTASLVNTSGLSTTVTFTPDNGNTAPSYNIIVGTIITANSASRKVTAVRYNNITVDTAVDWSGGYPYTYRNPYVSIADGSRPIFDINPSGNVGIGISTPSSSLHISGASAVLTLTPQTPLPSGVPTGSFAVSSSIPPKPYFYDGTAWNALY
jgi:hypothetical protein